MSNDPAHAIPAMLDLWPRYALLVRPELARYEYIAVSNTKCAIPRGGTATAGCLTGSKVNLRLRFRFATRRTRQILRFLEFRQVHCFSARSYFQKRRRLQKYSAIPEIRPLPKTTPSLRIVTPPRAYIETINSAGRAPEAARNLRERIFS
jgi:hypothetical protein